MLTVRYLDSKIVFFNCTDLINLTNVFALCVFLGGEES